MLARTLRIALATSVALPLSAVATPAAAQLVNSMDLVSAEDSAGNANQITISNPDANTANISVLAPVVVANWTGFNVPANTTLNVSNAWGAAQVSLLNRVIGGNFSDIGGTINADGVNLWLINQNGILFGSDTSVNASSFFASTLDLSDADFFDFYEGTNLAGNGSNSVRLLTNPFATPFIVAPTGASFKTDGTLFFVGPALSLDATFDAGTGTAAFVAATDVTVGFNAGSPVSYTINAGTTVASQQIDGSVTGGAANFVFQTAAGVLNAMLTVDADVATTAAATDTGIFLYAGGANPASVTVGGALSSTGDVNAAVQGDLTISQRVSGNDVALSASHIVASSINATESISGSGDSIATGNLTSGSSLTLNSLGAISTGSIDAGGLLKIGNSVKPTSVTFSGNVAAADVYVQTSGLLDAQDINATEVNSSTGTITLLTGSIDAGNVTATHAIRFNAANAGTASFASLVSTGGYVGNASGSIPLSITVAGETRGTQVTLIAIDDVSLGAIASTAGPLDVISTGGDVSTGAVMATGSNARLQAAGSVNATSIASTTAAIDVDSTGGGNLSLGNLSAAAGIALETSGTVGFGSADAGGAFTVGATVDPSTITATGNVRAGRVDFDVTGAFSGQSVTATAGMIDIDAGSVNAGALAATGSIAVEAPGPVSVASAVADTDSVGAEGLSIGATMLPSNLTVSGTSSGGSVDLQASGNLQLGNVTSTAGNVDLDSTGGSISTGAVSATGGNALLTAPSAINTTSITSLGGIDIDSTGGGALSLGNLSAAAPVYLDTSGSLSFGNVSAGTTLLSIGSTVIPTAVSTTGTINALTLSARTSGALNLNGANQIASLGTISAGGPIFINSITSMAIDGLVSAVGQDVTLKTSGSITLGSGGRVSGKMVALSAAQNFINNRGADAITASDHWVVYSSSPSGNTFGNLDSGNTAIWNAALATLGPQFVSGNRYVFAFQPTLTVVSTDAVKTYGTDVTDMLGANWTVTGFQPGVAGAYLGDTAANTLTGAPTITSAGSVANADVAGSPYVIAISQGSLGASCGYQLVLSSAGRLTVNPKPISATVSVDDKTYDGTTTGSGAVSSNDFLAGDDVTISGTTFTFVDKNAGIGKTVTVSGATLTGADASNYTLTVPASGLADILAKAISAFVSANDKTYDGTVAATGSVALSEVVTGDDVSTAGTTFTFSDKNAGIDKTVSVSGTVLTGADAGNYVVTVPSSTLASIFAKELTASLSANDKTYDGTTSATGAITLNGIVAGDSVGTTGSTFAFLDKNAGVDKTVTVSGTTLTGADAGNYTLMIPASTIASIFAKAISATVLADDKTYDGTTGTTGSVTLVGVVTGDELGTNGTTFTFSDKNAGADKLVAVAGTTLTGADAGNYTLTVPTSTLADILAKALTAEVTVNDKTYDGTTAGTGSVTLVGVVQGDNVAATGTNFTFGDKNAGTDKVVAVSGTALTGAGAENYTLTVPATALADILAKAITATATANDKTYDGTTAASGSLALNGIVAGDEVSTSGTAFSFADKNAGENKVVTASGTVLTGVDAGNYALVGTATALANILAKAITGTVQVNDKIYDGTTVATGTVVLSGVIAGDGVAATGTTFTFADKNAGNDKTVSVSGTTLTGAEAGNYSLTVPNNTLADILKRSIEIIADDAAKSQGTIDPEFTFSIGGEGLVAGDATTGSLQREPGEVVGNYAIGQGSLTAGPNYTITFTGATFTIERTPVPNTLRTQQLPSEIGASAHRGVLIEVTGLCREEDAACQQ